MGNSKKTLSMNVSAATAGSPHKKALATSTTSITSATSTPSNVATNNESQTASRNENGTSACSTTANSESAPSHTAATTASSEVTFVAPASRSSLLATHNLPPPPDNIAEIKARALAHAMSSSQSSSSTRRGKYSTRGGGLASYGRAPYASGRGMTTAAAAALANIKKRSIPETPLPPHPHHPSHYGPPAGYHHHHPHHPPPYHLYGHYPLYPHPANYAPPAHGTVPPTSSAPPSYPPYAPSMPYPPHPSSSYPPLHASYYPPPPPPSKAAPGVLPAPQHKSFESALLAQRPPSSQDDSFSRETHSDSSRAQNDQEQANDDDDDDDDDDEDLDDYERFVKTLGLDLDSISLTGLSANIMNNDDDDEEDEFQLDPAASDDDEDDEEEPDVDGQKNPETDEEGDGKMFKVLSNRKSEEDNDVLLTDSAEAIKPSQSWNSNGQGTDRGCPGATKFREHDSPLPSYGGKAALPLETTTPSLQEFPSSGVDDDRQENEGSGDGILDPLFYRELEQELGWLEEEDMEAAVATLLDYPSNSNAANAAASCIHTSVGGKTPLPPLKAQLLPVHAHKRSDTADGIVSVVVDTPDKSKLLGTMESLTKATASLTKTSHHAAEASPATSTSALGSSEGDGIVVVDSSPGEQGSIFLDPSRLPARTVHITAEQHDQLRALMEKHYQLLLQQAIIAVRAAHHQKIHKVRDRNDFLTGGETIDDVVGILDGSVGMLQDLDQHRKDALRHFIQFEATTQAESARQQPASNSHHHDHHQADSRKHGNISPRRSLLPELVASSPSSARTDPHQAPRGGIESCHHNGGRQPLQQLPAISSARRLTRAQFSKTLREYKVTSNKTKKTVFDIAGITELHETFAIIDKSVERQGESSSENYLEAKTHGEACRLVLQQSGAKYDESLFPAARDASSNFVDPNETLGPDFQPPCSRDEEMFLRRNRNLFTSGEDNLVLRGVNLYGEKQWSCIADRFLPDRSVNIISQRYSKLCVMMYKAHGIQIDEDGNLEPAPKYESPDDIDRVALSKLARVSAPAVSNVHRWSLEEDLILLKAVPIMGHMWAELGARLIPHRDRGHLRKRYQVLERRVKATVSRMNKHQKALQLARADPTVSSCEVEPQRSTSLVPSLRSSHPLTETTTSGAVLTVAKPEAPTASSRSCQGHNAGSASETSLVGGRSSVILSPVKSSHVSKAAVPHIPANLSVDPTGSAHKRVRGSHPWQDPSSVLSPGPESIMGGKVNEDGSRAAFEKLVHEANEEWSQLSSMKRIMDDNPEGEACKVIVMAQIGSPEEKCFNRDMPPDSFSRIDYEMESADFSMLDSYRPPSAKPNRSTTSKEHDPVSLFSGVLERTKHGDSRASKRVSERSSPDQREGMMDPPLFPSSATKRRAFEGISATTPKKYKMVVHSTPIQKSFFSTTGTPVGLSPNFPPGFSPSINSKGCASPALSFASFPGSKTSHLFMHAALSRDEPSMDIQALDEMDGMLTGSSWQDPTGQGGTPTSFEKERKAISALHALGESPEMELANGSARRESMVDDADEGPRKSLFAQVIGSVQGTDSSKSQRKSR